VPLTLSEPPLSPDHEQLIWDLTQNSIRAFTTEKLTGQHMISLGFTLKGLPYLWNDVSKKLDPSLQGPMAYLFGHRYLRLNQAKQAETFFKSALQAAPPGSSLHRLAEAEVEKLKKR
jgi:hypothetical protein